MRGQSPLRLEIMVRGEDRLMDVQYERRRRRVKMSRQVRVRPSSPVDKHFEEVRATVSASPDGLYFTTWRDAYYQDRKSTRLNSSHGYISYAVFCLKKKKNSTSRTVRESPAACGNSSPLHSRCRH